MGSSESYEAKQFRAFMKGALVGAGVALLLAPQTGSQLRGVLRDYAIRAREGLDEAADRGADMLDNTIEAGHEFVEKGKESLQEVRRKAKGFAEAGRNAVKETMDELASPK